MLERIGYVANIINSKMDTNGNTYWLMEVIRTVDGACAHGIINGGGSNCKFALRNLAELDGCGYRYFTKEIGVREYNKQVKRSRYLGCEPKDIVKDLLWQLEVCVAVLGDHV